MSRRDAWDLYWEREEERWSYEDESEEDEQTEDDQTEDESEEDDDDSKSI